MGIIKDFQKNGIPQNNRLKYSDSTLGQGPIISKPVPDDIQDTGFKKDEINSRTDDLKRISTLLTRNQGQKFILNNAALKQLGNAQNINKNITSGDFKLSLGKLKNTIVEQAKDTANLLGSTLAQVPVNGTGTHFVHKFRTDTYLNDTNQPAGQLLGSLLGKSGYQSAPVTLFGGDNLLDSLEETGKVESQFVSGSSEPTPSGRTTVGASKSIKTGLSKLTDGSKPKRVNLYRDENDDRRMSNRVSIGDPGKISYSITGSYDINNDISKREAGIDKINELSPSLTKAKSAEGRDFRDLINFRFKIITPETERWLYFRAFLDSFDDNYTGNWNSFNYVGRGEQFHTYSGFDRGISIGFKIAAQSRWEMKPIYQKMVALASTTAPTYNSEGFMRGTFVEMTVGSYLYQTPGIIESVQYSWQTDYPWEIAMNEPEQSTGKGGDTYQQELPMIMNCQVSFKPIHKFIPETGLKHYITQDKKGSNIQFFNDQTFTTKTDLTSVESTRNSENLAKSALGPVEKNRS